MSHPHPAQPELFGTSDPARPATSTIGSFLIRHDHAMLFAIGLLIGASVVFACGVERGKQLAKRDGWIMSTYAHMPGGQPVAAPEPSMAVPAAPAAETAAPSTEPAAESPATATPVAASAPKAAPAVKKIKAAQPAPRKKSSAPAKAASTTSGFAVQVVTYTKPQLAKQELARLKKRGEPAFLVTKQGRVSLYVGPFPSRQDASDKLASLRQQYQDCFVRSL